MRNRGMRARVGVFLQGTFNFIILTPICGVTLVLESSLTIKSTAVLRADVPTRLDAMLMTLKAPYVMCRVLTPC
jgi:hypothetical protein